MNERDNPVTVERMIEILKRFPPSARVIVSGYEGGVNDASSNPDLVKIRLNQNAEGYYGDHEVVEEGVYDCEAVYL